MNRSFISELEELVMLSVALLDPDAYAYAIAEEIKKQTGKSLSLASIHTVLYRLEKDGLLVSSLGGKSEKRGGRSKRLFVLTQSGKQTVKEVQEARQAIWTRIQTI